MLTHFSKCHLSFLACLIHCLLESWYHIIMQKMWNIFSQSNIQTLVCYSNAPSVIVNKCLCFIKIIKKNELLLMGERDALINLVNKKWYGARKSVVLIALCMYVNLYRIITIYKHGLFLTCELSIFNNYRLLS